MIARTPFRRLTTSLLAALALAAAASAAHAAEPTWHAVAPPIEDFPNSPPLLAFDPQGTAFAAWSNPGNGARLATRPSAGAFGAPVAFPTTTGNRWEFGFAANGEGVFVGNDGTGTLQAAVRGAGANGAFGPPQALGRGVLPKLAVNASGQALATGGGFAVAAPLAVAVRPAGGSFATESLAAAGSPSTVLVTGAALDADGSGVVVYLDAANVLQAVTRSEAGTWSGPTQVSSVPVTGVGALAASTAGDAVVVWNEGQTVRAAVRPRDGAFGAPQTVAAESLPNRLAADSVAIAADGTPFVTLDRFVMGRRICGDAALQGDVAELWRGPGGSWTRVAEQEGQDARVATSPTGGHVAFAWEGFVDPCAGGGGTPGIRARLGTVAGSLGADTLMPDQPNGQGVFANTEPSVGVDGAGNALVTWAAIRPETGGGPKLRVVAYDAGSAPPGGGGNPPGGGGGGGDTPPGPDFRDLLGLRAPVRRIPLDLNGSLPASVTVDARCLARRGTCRVNVNPTLGGSYTPARASVAARRGRRSRAVRFSIALPRVRATIRAGRRARLKITIRGRALAKARAALRAGGTVKLTIATTVNGVRAPRPLVMRLVAARVRSRRSG